MRRFINEAENRLIHLYPKEEVDSLIFRLISSTCCLNRAQFILAKEEALAPEKREELHFRLERLEKGEPLQYILGKTEFFGLDFEVNSAVLIPRPETEELVDLILRENTTPGLRVLDIGTGSGCIAISLAANLKNPIVEAWDVSQDALNVARKNALNNNQSVEFHLKDVLSCSGEELTGRFDIIVSNPPYVCDREKGEMHPNVLMHEPHLALFVPDHDPLIFYRKIAQLAQSMLKPNGKLYYEINQRFGAETLKLLTDLGFKNPELIPDIFGKDRMVKAGI